MRSCGPSGAGPNAMAHKPMRDLASDLPIVFDAVGYSAGQTRILDAISLRLAPGIRISEAGHAAQNGGGQPGVRAEGGRPGCRSRADRVAAFLGRTLRPC